MVKFLTIIMAVTSVLALPHAVLGSRYGNGIAHEDRDDSGDPSQDCVWMCGTTCYWLIDVQAAMRRGHKLQASGQGNDPDGYPHPFDNLENFDFPTPAPWYEFPILATYEVYKGGEPGPDRIIFDSDGQLEGLVTHSGADANGNGGFVMCVHEG